MLCKNCVGCGKYICMYKYKRRLMASSNKDSGGDKRYDLDVNNYTEGELIKVIKYPGDILAATPQLISSHINKMIVGAVKKDKGDELVNFLQDVNARLLNYIDARPPVQVPPMNYEVIQSMNNIQEDVHHTTMPKVAKVTNTYDYKFPAGVINPIERRTLTKVISIDSVFRQNYDTTGPSDFIWEMPCTANKVVSLKLVSLELPVMWYTISDKNNSNTFIVKTYNVCTHTDTDDNKVYEDREHLIEIPPGNYMAGDFAMALTNYFFNKGNGLQYMVCAVSSTTTKTIIRAREVTDGGASIYDVDSPNYSQDFYFEIDFGANIVGNCNILRGVGEDASSNPNPTRHENYNVGSFLGFTRRHYTVRRTDTYIDYIYTASTPVTYECYLASESSYGNGRINYVYVSVDDFNKNYIADSVVASTKTYALGDSIMGRVAVNESFSTVMLNTASDRIFKQRDYMGPVNISKFRIRILDKYGRVLDINNNDVSLALEATILYG